MLGDILKLPKYTSGWFHVTNGGSYTKTHNHNPPLIRVYYSNVSAPTLGTNSIYDLGCGGGHLYNGFTIRYSDANNFVIRIHNNNIFYTYSSTNDEVVSGYFNVFIY
jgi:hypothetical protein